MSLGQIATAVSLGALASCASAPPPPLRLAPAAPPVATLALPGQPTAGPLAFFRPNAETSLVEDVLLEVARARGLAPRRAVPCVRVDRPTLLVLVKQHISRGVPTAAIRAEGLVQKLLGLFPSGDDYEAATYAVLESSLEGYYEPQNGMMYLAADLDEAESRATLAHELVHALEDQAWDLGPRSAYAPGHEDRTNAASALAEGEATIVSLDLLQAREQGVPFLADDEVADQLRRNVEAASGGRAPPALRRGILAPYVDGARFVSAVRRTGGWRAVDRAWRTPPTTTEQVLHPEKWRVREPEIVLPDPPPPAGYSVIDTNTYGEQGLRLTFEEWMGQAEAERATSGWGGDRIALVGRPDGALALVWRVRFDEASAAAPAAFADRALTALTVALPRLGRVVDRGDRAMCIERQGNGALSVAREGRDLVVAVGAVMPSAGTWQPVMRCPELRAWSDAVASR